MVKNMASARFKQLIGLKVNEYPAIIIALLTSSSANLESCLQALLYRIRLGN